MPKSTLAVFLFVAVSSAATAGDPVARNKAVLVGNLDFLRDAPGTYFDQRDTELLRQTTTTSLNEAQDGEVRAWKNTSTGSSGEVKVVRTLPVSESKCRELQITNRAAGRSHTERSVFCYDANKGRWAMRPGK